MGANSPSHQEPAINLQGFLFMVFNPFNSWQYLYLLLYDGKFNYAYSGSIT